MLSSMYRRKIQKDKVTSDALMRQKPPKLPRGTNQEVLYFHLSIATKSGFLINVSSSKQPTLPEIMLDSFSRAAHISNESTRPLNTRKSSCHYARFCQQDSGSNSTPNDQRVIDDNSHKKLQHITCVKINEFNNDAERQQHIDQFLSNLFNIVSNSEN